MSKKKKPSEFNETSPENTFYRKNKLHLKKVIFSVFLLFFIALIALTFILTKYLSKVNTIEIDKNNLNIEENISYKETTDSNNSETVIIENNDIQNIVLFGIDETEGTVGRSDCIMILTIDNRHKKLKLSSIVRDSHVVISGREKKDKINHAYAFGGPQLALKTLNESFNLNLDKFVTVNFSSLPKIIDSIGGITLDITNDELKYINSYINDLNNINDTKSPNITTSGIQKVDGTQALAYCRIRYTDGGDFERSHRHRSVLTKVFEKSKTISITQYPSLLDELLPIVHTNLKSSEILSFAMDLNYLKNSNLEQDRFPRDEDGKGESIKGIYYYVFDEASTIEKMHDFIYEN